ncbi:hypothetical protein Hanom_Chr06g00549371 [Helianthus anomalus]
MLELKVDCILLFTKGFGNFFHLNFFGKNGVEMDFSHVDIDQVSLILLLNYMFCIC